MDKEYQQEIANTIIQQMGGRKLCAMVGAKNFTYGTIDYNGFEQPYMLFQFSLSRKYKYCRIIYNQGSDTYIFQLLNNKAVVKVDLTDVYAEDLIPLFEEKTGLYLSL
jgi:hypothetical protein